MDRRAKRLDTVTFLYPLWVKEADAPNSFVTETRMSAAGTHIVYETPVSTPYITLESRESGWLSAADRSAILSLYEQTGGGTFDLEYVDGTVEAVRFAREKPPVFSDLFEGGEQYYRATITLAKI